LFSADTVTACPGCDLLLELPACQVGETLLCPRCGQLLAKPKAQTVIRTCALSLMGLLLFGPANFLPLLTFEVFGVKEQGSIAASVVALQQQGYYLVAVLVALTGLVFPLLKFGLPFLISLQLLSRIHFKRLAGFMRWYQRIHEWGMVEIYLIAILVTIIKMNHLAVINYNVGFFCYLLMVGAAIGVLVVFDSHKFWELIFQILPAPVIPEFSGIRQPGENSEFQKSEVKSEHNHTARAAGLISCRTCHYLFYPVNPALDHWPCPRCGAATHVRIFNSLPRTWALIITAVILAIPANMLPIMEVNQLGVLARSTIMDGIIYFFQDGSYGIGMIIFTASILVPLFKIIGMLIVLNSIYFSRRTRLKPKTVMLRLISFISRWSMLDIYVIAFLCAVVDFGFFTNISIAPAASFFGAVVVATMFAAFSFDSRLLWDLS